MKKKGQGNKECDFPRYYNVQFPVNKYRDKGETNRNEAKEGTGIIPNGVTIG
jgi:hypothetical protein